MGLEGALRGAIIALLLVVCCFSGAAAREVQISTYTQLFNLGAVVSGDRISFAPGPFQCTTFDILGSCENPTLGEMMLANVNDVVIDGAGAVFDCACYCADPGCTNAGPYSGGGKDSRAFFVITNSTGVVIKNFDFTTVGVALFIQFSEVTVSNLFARQTIDRSLLTRAQGLRIHDSTVVSDLANLPAPDSAYTPSRVTLSNVWFNRTRGYYFGGAVQVHGSGASQSAQQTTFSWSGGGASDATVVNGVQGKGAIATLVAPYLFAFNASVILTDLVLEKGTFDLGTGGQCVAGGIAVFNTDLTVERTTIRATDVCTRTPSSRGGAIVVGPGSSLVLRDSIIAANTADLGGALHVTADNYCPNYVAASVPTSPSVSVFPSRVCDATTSGDAPSVRISGTTFVDNYARSRAGGIYQKAPSTILFEGSTPSSFLRDTHGAATASAIYCTDGGMLSVESPNTTLVFSGNVLGTGGSAVDCGGCGCCALAGVRATFAEFGSLDNTWIKPTCAYGYQLTAPEGVRCISGQQVPAVTSVCAAIPCPDLPSPENGRVSPPTGYFGSASTYTCRPGYTLSGPAVIKCGAGAWETAPSTCVGLPCPALSSVDYASLAYVTAHGEASTASAAVVGGSALVQCNAGYVLSGSTGWDCTVNAAVEAVWVSKTWINSTCTPVQCATGQGVEYTASCGTVAAYQRTCSFTCNAGHAGVTLNDVQCIQSGTNAQGSFAALPTCAPCVRDEYSNAGDPSCSSCENGYTTDTSSPGPGSCLCLAGFYDPVDQGKCLACPTGATCSGGKNMPVASPGYIQSAGAFIQCVPRASCGGSNACTTGYGGRLCGDCAPGYYRISGACSKCDRSTGANLAVGIIVLTILGLLLAWLATPNEYGGKESAGATIFSLLFFMQIVSILQDVRFEWESAVQGLFAIMSAFNYNIDLLNLECAYPGFNFYSRVSFYLALPLVMAGIYAGLLVVLTLLTMTRRRVSWREALHDNLIFVLGGYLLFGQTFYLAVTRYTFAFFACFEQGDGTYILSLAPGLQCYTPEWYIALGFPIFGLIFYVAGFPITCWWILRHYTRTGSVAIAVSHPLTHHYTARYQVAHREWELTVLLRKFTIALFLALFAQQPVLQAVLCGAVLFLACVASTVWHPLVIPRDNHIESVSLVGTFAILFAGLISVPTTVSGDARYAIGIVIILIVAVEVLPLIALLSRDTLASSRHISSVKQNFKVANSTKLSHSVAHVINVADAGAVAIEGDTIAVINHSAVERSIEAPGTITLACALQPGAIVVVAEGTLYVYDITTGKKSYSEELSGETTALAASQEVLVAAVRGGASLRIWRRAQPDSARLEKEAASDNLPDGVVASALVAVGFHVWVGDRNGRVLRVDALSGKSSALWAAHETGVTITCLAARDNLLLVGGNNGVIVLFDTTLNQATHSLIGHHGPVASLSLIPGGAFLLSGAHDGTVRLWDTGKTPGLLATLQVPHSAHVAVYTPHSEGARPLPVKAAAAWTGGSSDAAEEDAERGGAVGTRHESVHAIAAGSKGMASFIGINPAIFARREKQAERACCARQIEEHNKITGRMNNEEAEAAFWSLDRRHLSASLKGYVSVPLLERLSLDEQRTLHRVAHVADRVSLERSQSGDDSADLDASKNHSGSDGHARSPRSTRKSAKSLSARSGASGSSVAPLSSD